MPELLSARRQLVSSDYANLRTFIPRINKEIPDYASVKWRSWGEAAVTLFERGEFQRALGMKNGLLKIMGLEEIDAVVKESFRQSEHGSLPLNDVTTVRTEAFGVNLFSIAYVIEDDRLIAERKRLTDVIDDLNGVNISWRDYVPHITIATSSVSEAIVIEAFEAIRPKNSIKLQPFETVIG